MNRLKLAILTALLLLGGALSAQEKPVPLSDSLYRSLAATPPMGWNSWNKFGCNVSEKLIKEMADAMAASGMADAGYEYIHPTLQVVSHIASGFFTS